MDHNPRRLLDQLTLIHGPHELLGRFFVAADQAGQDIGLRFRLRSDFDGLLELNRDNGDTWPPLPPICDPAHSNIRFDAGFWLEGIDERGETVVTHAARLFDFTRSNLQEEIRSLRIFYEDAASHIAAGERVDIESAAAAAITGRTMFAGGVWVRPDWRRFGLTKIISRVCSAYAYTRWNIAYSWGFVETRMHALGLSRAYGPYNVIDGLSFRLAWRPDVRMVLLWMGVETMLADLGRVIERTAEDGARERYAHDEAVAASGAPGQR